MSRYAEGTSVAPEASRAEIERTLRRYGADGFLSGYDNGQAFLLFRAHGRMVRFSVPMPDPSEFTQTPAGRKRDAAAARSAAEGEERRRWRALALAVKAKLEVVETGIATFEQEFLAHVVLPNGTTVGQWIEPQLEEAYADGGMPAMLALGSGE
jgi:hypothetical protein